MPPGRPLWLKRAGLTPTTNTNTQHNSINTAETCTVNGMRLNTTRGAADPPAGPSTEDGGAEIGGRAATSGSAARERLSHEDNIRAERLASSSTRSDDPSHGEGAQAGERAGGALETNGGGPSDGGEKTSENEGTPVYCVAQHQRIWRCEQNCWIEQMAPGEPVNAR